jgi:hypothetical protein
LVVAIFSMTTFEAAFAMVSACNWIKLNIYYYFIH